MRIWESQGKVPGTTFGTGEEERSSFVPGKRKSENEEQRKVYTGDRRSQ